MTHRNASTLGLSLVCGLLSSLAADAQPFAQDFEAGSFGAWQLHPATGQTASVTSAAAHRGALGVRFTDTETTINSNPGTYLYLPLEMTMVDVYERGWARVEFSGGRTLIFGVSWQPTGGGANGVTYDQGELHGAEQPALANGGAGYANEPLNFTADDAGWMLIEGATLNRGAGNATMMYAVNGQELRRVTGQSAYSSAYDSFNIGQVYSNGPLLGHVDFDDVRADSQPMPSRLKWAVIEAAVAQHCTEVKIELSSSWVGIDGGLIDQQPAPYDLDLALTGTPFFTDPACATPAATPVLAKSQTTLPLFIRPTSGGPVQLHVANPDFISGDLKLDVTEASTADGGSGQASYYAIHCSSANGGLQIGAALLILFAALRRRIQTQ